MLLYLVFHNILKLTSAAQKERQLIEENSITVNRTSRKKIRMPTNRLQLNDSKNEKSNAFEFTNPLGLLDIYTTKRM